MPKNLEFLDEEDEKRKCQEFKDHLIKFQRELGVENFKVPSIGGKELDLCKLYKAVISRGGSQRVSNNKLWKEIVNEFEIPQSCTSASFTLRNHYNKCLLQYEKKYFLGQNNIENDKNGADIATGQNGAPIGQSYQQPFYSSSNQFAIPPSYGVQMYQHSQNPQHQGRTYASIPGLNSLKYDHGFNHQQQHQQQQQHHHHQPASVNPNSKYQITKKVRLSQVEAESKRLVLAFESRINKEINWALNTLAIFSCNTNQNFTLENQPYLLESISNYLVYCIQNVESLSYNDPFDKKHRVKEVNVPSYVDALTSTVSNPQQQNNNIDSFIGQKLDYKTFGSFTKEIRKREGKYEDKKKELMEELAAQQQSKDGGLGGGLQQQPKVRGRKPKIKILEEQNALDELRKKRKKLVTVLHQEVTELELIDHLRMIILIVRNLSFIRANEHHLIKCVKLLDIVTSLFVDLIDREITFNCLDIISNLGKHLVLNDLNCGRELVEALFGLFSSADTENIVDQCVECLRRLSLSAGNEEYLEEVREEDIQNLINLLMSSNVETREGCLEILCTISDRKTTLKVKIAHQKKCIERLIGLIATGSQTANEEKISKLAALTLANLNLAPSNRALIVPYEQELALIAASDEKTCKIIAEILGDLDSYQVYSK